MVIRFLIEKEFKQMVRNVILPIVFVMLPLGMINVMPKAATQEVKNLKISVVDNDHSSLSERLVHNLSASAYFHLADYSPSYDSALHRVEAGDADFIIEIEPDFERNLMREGVSRVMISANAVNGVKAGLGSSYLAQIVADYSAQLREEMGLDASSVRLAKLDVSPRYLYNAELDYKAFMVPGLMAMLMILIVGFLPALNIVGEKLIPYWIVGLVILGYAMLLARGIYGMVPAGSIGLIFLFATVFILVVSSFGLIVSNYSDTMQQAALVMFFFLVIFILLSGLLTPVASMPRWAQIITTVNPLRYFIEAMRVLYLKGSSFTDLLPNLFALSAYAVVVGTWAIVSYRTNS